MNSKQKLNKKSPSSTISHWWLKIFLFLCMAVHKNMIPKMLFLALMIAIMDLYWKNALIVEVVIKSLKVIRPFWNNPYLLAMMMKLPAIFVETTVVKLAVSKKGFFHKIKNICKKELVVSCVIESFFWEKISKAS